MKKIIAVTILIAFTSTSPTLAQSVNDIVNSTMEYTQKQIDESTKDVFGKGSKNYNSGSGYTDHTGYTKSTEGFSLTNTELRNQSFVGRDLKNASFVNTDLYNIDFSKANLTGATFTNVDFHNVKFNGAIMNSTQFTNVDFIGGDLRGAVLNGATIKNADFSNGVKLHGVDLSKASLTNVDYDGADFNTPWVVTSNTITQKLTQKPADTKYHSNANIDLAILFEFNSDKLQSQAWGQLTELSKALSNPTLSNSRFMIEGHTDAKGSDEYNNDLSYRRAFSVQQALIKQLGVNPQRLSVKGYGESRPVANNETDYGRSLNRRVTIVNLGGM